jgi:signal transduction histidine kinase
MNGKEHKLIHFIGGIPLFIALMSIYFAAGHILSQQLFRWTGTPPEIAAHIISGILGTVIFIIVLGIILFVRERKFGVIDNHRSPFGSEVMRAIEEISKGNFNIFLTVDKHGPLKELAESVNQMARELGSMEKLRQDFISDVSHEFQSPLTSIGGFAALLRQDGISGEDVKHYASIIETESRRLSKLSENLLKLSALEADGMTLETAELRLDKQLENILLMLEPQWTAKRISPELSLAKVTIDGNSDLLNQVWINLLHNAIKFTPEEGTISVTLTETNGDITCTVADNGIGIPQELQPRVFERFFKADKSRDRTLGGNGLGLSLVRKIVELHGGTVTVESEPDNGSAFTVRLPSGKN